MIIDANSALLEIMFRSYFCNKVILLLLLQWPDIWCHCLTRITSFYDNILLYWCIRGKKNDIRSLWFKRKKEKEHITSKFTGCSSCDCSKNSSRNIIIGHIFLLSKNNMFILIWKKREKKLVIPIACNQKFNEQNFVHERKIAMIEISMCSLV